MIEAAAGVVKLALVLAAFCFVAWLMMGHPAIF